jgi:hypothetical protein
MLSLRLRLTGVGAIRSSRFAPAGLLVEARRRGVRRLVFAHIGRPTIRAMDAGRRPAFGTFGRDGQVFHPRRWRG